VFAISEILFGSSFSDVQRPVQGPASSNDSAIDVISLVLAGPHPLTLYGLSHMFDKEPGWNVLTACTTPDAILEALRRHQPDLLILDLDRAGGLVVLRRVRREHPSARVVVLAAASDNRKMMEALRLGARAVVPKELAPEALIAYVRKIHADVRTLETEGEQSFATRDVGQVVGRFTKTATPMRHISRHLTPREAEIARLAIRGISTKDIAMRLGLKHGTVKIHLHSIYEKLDVDGRLGLILIGRRHGLA
jgi:DNA-binding NarL/FixJ family response regulator